MNKLVLLYITKVKIEESYRVEYMVQNIYTDKCFSSVVEDLNSRQATKLIFDVIDLYKDKQ